MGDSRVLGTLWSRNLKKFHQKNGHNVSGLYDFKADSSMKGLLFYSHKAQNK